MNVLQLKAKTDQSGNLRLDIPTSSVAAEMNVVVVLTPLMPDAPNPSRYDFSDLVGKLSWTGDAVAQQRDLRDEW